MKSPQSKVLKKCTKKKCQLFVLLVLQGSFYQLELKTFGDAHEILNLFCSYHYIPLYLVLFLSPLQTT